ncbi:glycosyltransferase family 2 protein [bacterium]|nr:glycosyltransferase family 2 protein [bacterium]
MKAFAILTAIGAAPEQVVQSLMALQRTHTPTIYLHRPEDSAPQGPDTRSIQCECKTLGQMLKNARTSVPADLYLWIPPGVAVQPDGLDHFVEACKKHPDASLIVSNYKLNDREVAIHPFKADLTEREDFGAVWGIPAKALDQVGGPNLDLKHTTFYDLRLKLAEIGELVHVEETTYAVQEPGEEEASKSSALFYPGRGAYGGFSYLFMDPEEEKETEQVLYDCLKRRGAWLDERDTIVDPAPRGEDDPIVSVVIPVHNRAKFLPLAVESVKRGTMQDFEIIIVDNASSDNSLQVAEELAAKDSRIRVIANDVNLIARALNMGVKAARGTYISQLDSDDEYTANTLEDMVGHLEAHPKCGLAISYYELMDEKGTTLEDFGIIKHLEYNINNIMRVDGAGAVRTWHKSVILEFGGFNDEDFPNYGEDYDLVLKVGEKYNVDRVHSVCYRYRRHPGNTDALRRPIDKIRAKTFARSEAVKRRRAINGVEG